MLAQSHARRTAPPLAARGMWLRLHGGADAFGSALGDAVVGSITQGDGARGQAQQQSSKPLTQAEIDYYLSDLDPVATSYPVRGPGDMDVRELPPSEAERPGPYKVRRGDNLEGIADGDKAMMGRYISGSSLKDPNKLRAGQSLSANWDMSDDDAVALANRFYAADGKAKAAAAQQATVSNQSTEPVWSFREASEAQRRSEREAMPVRVGQGGSPGAYLSATPASRDAQTRYEANTLGIALLGPVFGALPAAARVLGAPEWAVENFAQINFDLGMAAAGLPRRSGVAPADYFPRNGTTSGSTSGRFTIETGAKPDANEIRAGVGLGNAGYDVTYQATASSRGISNQRTADLSVSGVGPVDVYTPQSANPNSIVRAIEKKNSQAGAIIVQSDLSSQAAQSIAGRVYGKPSAGNIQTLFFQGKDGIITTVRRPQ